MESELLKISHHNFEELKSRGILKFHHLDIEMDYIPCSIPCEKPCAGMKLESPPLKKKNIYATAFCELDKDIDILTLKKEDLSAYIVDYNELLKIFRITNSLKGNSTRIDQNLYLLGESTISGYSISQANRVSDQSPL